MRVALSLFFFLWAHCLSGQQTVSLRIRVTDDRGQAIPVNARLLSLPDSALVRAGTFPDGQVTLTNLTAGAALLRLSQVAFQDSLFSVYLSGNTDLGVVRLQERSVSLGEVRIRAQPPLIRQGSNGAMEVQVAGTVLAGSLSPAQILERSPGITFSDGRFSVIGKGEALIFLDGQAISHEQLMAIPVARILRIEIIANPGSRYDAEGKAIIRVVTKPADDGGLSGSVHQQLTYTKFAGGESNTLGDLSYRKGKLTLATNLTLRAGNDREILHTTRTRPDPAIFLKSDLRTDWQRKLRPYASYGVGIQYAPSEKSYLSLGYKGNLDRLGGYQFSRNKLVDAVSEGLYQSRLEKDEQRLNHSLTFNYQRQLDSLGSSFFLGSQLARFGTDIHDRIFENNRQGDSLFSRNLLNDQRYRITISSTQADYVKAFRNSWRLEAGAKVSYARTRSSTYFQVSSGEAGFQPDPTLSSRFAYTEWIPALYVSLNGRFGTAWSFGTGVRGEWTRYDLSTTAGDGHRFERQYVQLFPSFFLTRKLSSERSVRLSYTAKISRPRYQALNPFVIYQDPFTTIQGNPNLQPEKVHAFEAGISGGKWDLRAGYNFTRDPLSGAALRGDAPNSYVLKGINLEQDHTFFVTGSTTVSVGGWNTTNTVTVSQSRSVDHQYGFAFVRPRPQIYLYSSNSYRIAGWFTLQVLAWYQGARYYGLYHNFSRATVTIGVERDIWKGLGKIRLTANDIFHQTRVSGTYSVGATDIYFHRTYATSGMTAGFSYRFGKVLKTGYKSRQTAETEQNRAR